MNSYAVEYSNKSGGVRSLQYANDNIEIYYKTVNNFNENNLFEFGLNTINIVKLDNEIPIETHFKNLLSIDFIKTADISIDMNEINELK